MSKQKNKKSGNFKKTASALALGSAIALSGFAFAGCDTQPQAPSWLSGENTPTANVGKVGDLYIDTNDYILYQKSDSETWTKVMDNFGKPGEPGAPGDEGDPGTPGKAGNIWITGTQNPNTSSVDGAKGDLYLDTQNKILYQMGDTSWQQLMTNFGAKGDEGDPGDPGDPGKAGNVCLSGDGSPITNSVEGAKGDLYIDTTNKVLYQKNDTTWVLIIQNFGAQGETGGAGKDGATWIVDNTAPDNTEDGKDGDLYLYTGGETNTLYVKSNGTWAVLQLNFGAKGETGGIGGNGADGSTWLKGTQLPSDSEDGKNGDFYLYTGNDSNTLYYKVSNVWVELITNFGAQGENGATWIVDNTAPDNIEDGKDGDMYLDTNAHKIYLKVGGAWTMIQDNFGVKGEDGTKWLSGIGNPNDLSVSGRLNDLYLDTDSKILYQKNDTTWVVLVENFGAKGETGSAGKDGATWLTGEGNPTTNLIAGNDNDLYLDTANNILYQMTDSVWSPIINDFGSKGEDGTKWLTGSGYPQVSEGRINDLYLDTTNNVLYEKTAEDTWTIAIENFGTKGEKGDDGRGIEKITTKYEYDVNGDLYLVFTITYTDTTSVEVKTLVPVRATSASLNSHQMYIDGILYIPLRTDDSISTDFTLSANYDNGDYNDNVSLTTEMLYCTQTIDFTTAGTYENVRLSYNGYLDNEYNTFTVCVYDPEQMPASSIFAIVPENPVIIVDGEMNVINFDKSNCKVHVNYIDGTNSTLSFDANGVSVNTSNLSLNANVIEVSYGGKTSSFNAFVQTEEGLQTLKADSAYLHSDEIIDPLYVKKGESAPLEHFFLKYEFYYDSMYYYLTKTVSEDMLVDYDPATAEIGKIVDYRISSAALYGNTSSWEISIAFYETIQEIRGTVVDNSYQPYVSVYNEVPETLNVLITTIYTEKLSQTTDTVINVSDIEVSDDFFTTVGVKSFEYDYNGTIITVQIELYDLTQSYVRDIYLDGTTSAQIPQNSQGEDLLALLVEAFASTRINANCYAPDPSHENQQNYQITITQDMFDVSELDTSTVGQKTAYITYGGKKAQITVMIMKAVDPAKYIETYTFDEASTMMGLTSAKIYSDLLVEITMTTPYGTQTSVADYKILTPEVTVDNITTVATADIELNYDGSILLYTITNSGTDHIASPKTFTGTGVSYTYAEELEPGEPQTLVTVYTVEGYEYTRYAICSMEIDLEETGTPSIYPLSCSPVLSGNIVMSLMGPITLDDDTKTYTDYTGTEPGGSESSSGSGSSGTTTPQGQQLLSANLSGNLILSNISLYEDGEATISQQGGSTPQTTTFTFLTQGVDETNYSTFSTFDIIISFAGQQMLYTITSDGSNYTAAPTQFTGTPVTYTSTDEGGMFTAETCDIYEIYGTEYAVYKGDGNVIWTTIVSGDNFMTLGGQTTLNRTAFTFTSSH